MLLHDGGETFKAAEKDPVVYKEKALDFFKDTADMHFLYLLTKEVKKDISDEERNKILKTIEEYKIDCYEQVDIMLICVLSKEDDVYLAGLRKRLIDTVIFDPNHLSDAMEIAVKKGMKVGDIFDFIKDATWENDRVADIVNFFERCHSKNNIPFGYNAK